MSESTTFHGKVPMGQKIAFGLGMLANQMFPAALGIFMVVLVQDLGFPGWMWGVIYFFPRIFDSLTDPIMGFISDNTKSKWGRRRQYVFIGAIIMGISFVMMWQLYRDNSLNYNFTYFMLWSFVFYLGLTIFSVPYVAMGYEMTDDFHERTNIMATAQWIGQWAWVIAPWFWVIMYDPDWFPNADTATRSLSIWVGIACMLLAMVPAFFIKSKSTLNDNSLKPLTFSNIGGSLIEIFKGFVAAFSIKPFRKLCISTFLIFNAFNTIAAFVFFIVVYHLFAGDANATGYWTPIFGSVGALITTFFVIPAVAWLSKQYGKKRAFLISQAIALIGYVLLWFLFVPGKPWLFLFALPFHSFGIGSLFTIMMSMTADVCDIDELNTGKRREGLFGAIYWWMVKFGFAIAGLASGLIMSLVGFDPSLPEQPEGAVTGLRLFFSGLPITGTLLAMYIMKDYSVTEEKAAEIRKQLDARKNNEESVSFSSSYYPSNKELTSELSAVALPTSYGVNLAKKSDSLLKEMFTQTLNSGLHGLSFSPYVEGQDVGDILTETQIRKRMSVIEPYTSWVRSFSCTDGNDLIPKIARNSGLKTLVGAWISNDKAKNEKEIARLIELAKKGNVDIAAVGNEVLLRGELSLTELIGYIQKVKAALPNIPVVYIDTYHIYYENPELFSVSDAITVNCYPFWEGDSIDNALDKLRKVYHLMKQKADGKEVIITETGWPSAGDAIESAYPTKRNASEYFIYTENWSQQENIPLFYFSSFDESWKIRTEGEIGTKWGLWDNKENLKY